MSDFWIPTYKYEFVDWLEKQYSKDKQGRVINWNKFPLKRLKAIYLGIRRDYENAHASSSKSVGVRKEKNQDSPIFRNETGQNSGGNPMGKDQEAQLRFDFSA